MNSILRTRTTRARGAGLARGQALGRMQRVARSAPDLQAAVYSGGSYSVVERTSPKAQVVDLLTRAPNLRTAVYSGGSYSVVEPTTPKAQVVDLLTRGYGSHNKPDTFAPVISELVKDNPTPQAGAQTLVIGQGAWEVFYAPHIGKIASTFGAEFNIRYTLRDTTFTSNVKYSSPLLGQGWLSAGGSLTAKYDDTVYVHFDRFWVDGANSLRPDVPAGDEASSSLSVDSIMSALGRAAFFPQLALFPVLYLDQDIAVFKFPPLDSLIAVRRVST